MKRFQLRRGTTAQRTAIAAPLNGEPFFDTDFDVIFVYESSGAAWRNTGSSAAAITTPFQSGTDGSGTHVTAAGNTNYALAATDILKTVNLVVDGGGGVYTATQTLQTTNGTAGDHFRFILALPASANPTIEFRNATSGGTLLATVTGDGAGAQYATFDFVYTGSAWILERASYHAL